jgi:3-deoxy-D-manno-octulosonic-acid transferase
MFFIYSIIYSISVIFLLPFEYFRRPGNIRKRWLREKFGFWDNPPFMKGGIIWIHAVSVGEVMAATPLLKALKEKYPSRGIILSTVTDTGQKVAKERAPEGTKIVYLPFDIPQILNAVVKKVMPAILIVIETELWPNMFRVFKQNGIPIIPLNGRISENSFRGYKKISFFMKKVLSCVDFFGMQNEEYAERLKSLGVHATKIRSIGNFKFDTRPLPLIPVWTERIQGPVVTAGSTHEGEEDLMTSVYLELRKEFPDLNLILAPRHPERFQNVEEMLKSKRASFIKRSAFSTQHLSPSPSPSPLEGKGQGGGTPNPELQTLRGTIILLDTIGELSAIYGISDMAIIGKSFRGSGGQNPLEPAYWGKPIICGPHMENFPVIRDFYRAGAAIEVDENNLYAELKELLLFPEKAREVGLRGHEIYRKNAGAVKAAMEIVARYLPDVRD